MNIIEIIAQDVFDKVRGRFENLEMGDEAGAVTSNPKDARFFDFDFTVEGNNLGRVSVSLNELGTLKVFYGHDIVEDSNAISTDIWYDFLKEMRFFAKRRMLRFDTRDITKGNLNKNDFQYLAQTGTKENTMSESSMYGSTKTSYRKLENTLLRIRHNKAVDENQRGARSRNINALFIENESGERFKYPFIHLAGAKAMQRHVSNGGRPYDNVGNSIIGMSEQVAQLTAFKRHLGNHDGMNEEVNEILERSQVKLENLRKTIEGLSKQGFYEQYVNSFESPSDESFVMDQATMEDYKAKFTVKNFKEDLAQYFPLIHKIMQETSEVDLESYVVRAEEKVQESEVQQSDDFAQFEEWADDIVEGTTKFTPEEEQELQDIAAGNSDLIDGTPLYDKMFQYYQDNGEMPYGIAKARDGDPEDWLADKIAQDFAPTEDTMAESPEDRTSYQVAKILFDKGIKYDAAKEDDLIGAIGMILVKDLNMSPKQARSMISYDEDFVSDTLSELGQMGNENMENEEPTPEKPNMREVAEVVKSFYDAATGKFPKGETGVITHIKKQFGDHAGAIAERFVEQLAARGQQVEQQQMATQQFEDIKRLAGLAK